MLSEGAIEWGSSKVQVWDRDPPWPSYSFSRSYLMQKSVCVLLCTSMTNLKKLGIWMFIVAAKLSLFTLSSPHLLHLNLPLPWMCLSVYLPNNNKRWQTFLMGPKRPLIWFHSGMPDLFLSHRFVRSITPCLVHINSWNKVSFFFSYLDYLEENEVSVSSSILFYVTDHSAIGGRTLAPALSRSVRWSSRVNGSYKWVQECVRWGSFIYVKAWSARKCMWCV